MNDYGNPLPYMFLLLALFKKLLKHSTSPTLYSVNSKSNSHCAGASWCFTPPVTPPILFTSLV